MTRIVAVTSGKGGVGKTFLSISLAHALALRGRRVLLFDGDLGLANIDVQLGLHGRADLRQAVIDDDPLQDLIWHEERLGIDLIVGHSGSGSLAAMPNSMLNPLLGQVRELAPSYDIVLLDTPSGLQSASLGLSKIADEILMVTDNQPTTLTDNYAFIKVACRADIPISLIANDIREIDEGEAAMATLGRVCRQFLNRSIGRLGMVRHDRQVAAAIRRQVPFLTHAPASQVARDIEKVAANVHHPISCPA